MNGMSDNVDAITAMDPPEALMRALGHDPESLKDAPNGGKVRQKDKPWITLGISRASWYRQGKPEEEWQLSGRKYNRQKNRASVDCCSIRTVQRESFIRRYGIPELDDLVLAHHFLTAGMVAEVARWERSEQWWFINRLLELIRESGQQRQHDASYEHHSIVFLTIYSVDRAVLRRLAKQALWEGRGDLPYRWGLRPETEHDKKCWCCHSPDQTTWSHDEHRTRNPHLFRQAD